MKTYVLEYTGSISFRFEVEAESEEIAMERGGERSREVLEDIRTNVEFEGDVSMGPDDLLGETDIVETKTNEED